MVRPYMSINNFNVRQRRTDVVNTTKMLNNVKNTPKPLYGSGHVLKIS